MDLDLYADSPCSTFGDTLHLQLNVNQTCPPGFNNSQDECACVCDQVLQKYTNHCNITDGLGQLTRKQRRRRHFKSGQATANKITRACARGGGGWGGSVHNRQCAAVKTTYEIKCVGAETGRSGRARLLIRRQKA